MGLKTLKTILPVQEKADEVTFSVFPGSFYHQSI